MYMSDSRSGFFNRRYRPQPDDSARFRAFKLRRTDNVARFLDGRCKCEIVGTICCFGKEHIQRDSLRVHCGKLIEHLGRQVATPGITAEPDEARFLNRHDGDVIGYWQRTSSSSEPVPRIEFEAWHPPSDKHPKPCRHQQQSRYPTDPTRPASGP